MGKPHPSRSKQARTSLWRGPQSLAEGSSATDRTSPASGNSDTGLVAGHYAASLLSHKQDLLRGAFAALRQRARAALHASAFWQRSLGGPAPDRLLVCPQSFFTKSPAEAELMLMGRYRLPGGEVTARDGSPFFVTPPSDLWAESLHGFHWLRHFEAGGAEPFQDHLRQLVAHWLRTCGDWHPVGWRPHVIARRLMTWSSFGRFLFANADILFRARMLLSMARQARHLARTAHLAPPGLPRLTAAIGLVQSGVCLPDGEARLSRGLNLLALELSGQILPDGGHVSRNPEALLEAASDLLSLVDAMTQRELVVPVTIRRALDRMMPMIRFMRHPDGGLWLFNGAGEGPPGWADALLMHDGARSRSIAQAPQSGYQRMQGGDAVVVVDAGRPPQPDQAGEAHAGTLSFELAVGSDRLFVNGGASRTKGADWQEAMRATAAHSTLVVDDQSSAHVIPPGWGRSLLGPRLVEGPTQVRARRRETEEGVTLSLAHDGYAPRFGATHERVLHLQHDGSALSGEDRLVQSPDQTVPPFAVRFHLHPSVRVVQQAGSVDLLAPGGTTWRFTTDAAVDLAESVYLGQPGQIRKSMQLVVTEVPGRHTGQVKWTLRRLGASERTESSVN